MTSTRMQITVALDAEHTRQSAAGIARYARGLATALRNRGDVSVIELGGGEVVPRGTLRKRAVTARQDFLWYPWMGRRRARSAGADIYHVPLPRGPMLRGKPPLVVTVMDLVSLLFPETTTPWSRIYSRLTLRRLLDVADMILAPSRNSADDLNSLLGLSFDRIRVVPIGVDECFFRTPGDSIAVETIPSSFDSDAAQATVRSREPYVLFVGTPEPRKNLDRLVAAMALLRRRGSTERLVIAGGGGWGGWAGTGVDASVVERLGRVSDSDLRALYMHASCLALPSLHEGFGLPAVEAMAAGTPVVAARVGALPEITAGAAVLVDPFDVSDIADGIERCIRDRASLTAAGHARAKDFSWERAAAGTNAVYRELV